MRTLTFKQITSRMTSKKFSNVISNYIRENIKEAETNINPNSYNNTYTNSLDLSKRSRGYKNVLRNTMYRKITFSQKTKNERHALEYFRFMRRSDYGLPMPMPRMPKIRRYKRLLIR